MKKKTSETKNFKKWNRDQTSKKFTNKLEIKEAWKQMKMMLKLKCF